MVQNWMIQKDIAYCQRNGVMAMSNHDYRLFGSLKLVCMSNLKKLMMWARQTLLLV